LELRRYSQGGLLSDLRRIIHYKKKVNTFLFPARESLVCSQVWLGINFTSSSAACLV